MGLPSTTPSTSTTRAGRHLPRTGTRGLLLADAALTGVNGLAYLVLPGVLGELFGISTGLLVGIGVFLLVVAGEIAFLATRAAIPRLGVLLVAEVNAAWVVGSVLFAAVADLTTVGVLWTLAQAAVVAAFAVRQVLITQR